jgi:hypothetical protein
MTAHRHLARAVTAEMVASAAVTWHRAPCRTFPSIVFPAAASGWVPTRQNSAGVMELKKTSCYELGLKFSKFSKNFKRGR